MEISLATNQLVTVRIESDDSAGQLQSRFEGVEAGLAWIAAPTVRGVTVWPSVGARVRVSWLRQDAIYSFTSEVHAVRSSPAPMLGLVCPPRFDREQRREGARVELWLVPEEIVVAEADGPERQVEAVVTSLSASGALLRLKEPLGIGASVRLRLSLPPNGEDVVVCGEVVRVGARPARNHRWHAVGVRFVSPTLRDSKRLAGFVLRRQVELVKRGVAE